jgi:hypothetical protein
MNRLHLNGKSKNAGDAPVMRMHKRKISLKLRKALFIVQAPKNTDIEHKKTVSKT